MGSARHIGIILDGNRRYAKSESKTQLEGHKLGAENVKRLIMEWAPELGIRELTLYAFSMQNFNRPKPEFEYLMELFSKFFGLLTRSKGFREKNIRVRFLGRIKLFPKSVYDSMHKIMEKTRENTGLVVNFCMAYGGREEIVDATRALAQDVAVGKIRAEEVSPEMLNRYMYLREEPELIIRTGGEHRTSNFLMWQSWYSEWFFVEKFWPEFTKEDLQHILLEFTQRERRFGK